MKKHSLSVILAFMLLVPVCCGCSKKEAAPDMQAEGETAQTSTQDEEILPKTTQSDFGQEVPEETEEETQTLTPEDTAEEAEAKNFYIENPSNTYYYAGEDLAPQTSSVQLRKISESANEITDVEKWLLDNNLTRPSLPYADSHFMYSAWGDGGSAYETYRLDLYDMEGKDAATGNPAAQLDFSEYCYAGQFKQEDVLYIRQRICYAKAEEQVLYVAIAHNTYSVSSPCTAYVVAVDLSDGSVIWKTDPLTCNSQSFEIIGDVIVCGYGFTAEDDFLKIIDKHTGRLLEQIPVKTQPDYIIRSDNLLYVRTYNTDYVFEIIEK